ncbi:MAG: hypothetical protein Q8L81_18600 [Bacteroidota bacterium]|nr:hypothetical protein [Bacteroidota bacterium]
MKENSQNIDSESTVSIRRGRVESVDLFEVKEHELEILENGGSDSIYLNFSIFLISIALSAIFSLCTSTFSLPIYQTLFLIIAVVGMLGGIFLLILWLKQRKSTKSVVKIIRGRIQYIGAKNVIPAINIDQTNIDIINSPTELKP